jgi:hypothetical protein
LLIHASRTIDKDGISWTRKHFSAIALPESFETGGIVGVAWMTGVVHESTSPWFIGPVGFVLRNARPLPFLRMHGRLGIFSAPPVARAWLDHHGGPPS